MAAPRFRALGAQVVLEITQGDQAGTATVHAEGTGLVGVSCPVWIAAQTVATAAAPLLRDLTDRIARHAADDACWRPTAAASH